VSGLIIRGARSDELDLVASTVVDAYAEYAARMSPDAWSMYAQDIANVRGRVDDAELVVAERDGRIVGAADLYLRWRGAQEDSAAVRLLAVPPRERGTGVGRALMEHCVERAREAGKKRVVLTTTMEMESARELNESLGFLREPGLDHMPAPGVRCEGFALKL
jgi:GNAT superfamily N-acetyltransferase